MKISKKVLVTCLLLMICANGAFFLRVSAQNTKMTSQQTERIVSSCVSAKATLTQLHTSDALLRVNMGQIYESMSTKLMNKFNGRLKSNGYSNSGITEISTNYETMLDKFRSNYITYEEHLSLALFIDCSKQPTSFYDAVTSARVERERVHSDVLKLNQIISQYKSSVDQFEKNYQSQHPGVKKQ